MSIDIKSLTGSSIQETRNREQATQVGDNSNSGAAAAPSGGEDRVTLTGAVAKLQALEARLAALPVVDSQLVQNVQRALATGSFHYEPQTAADNLVEQEKNFALISGSK
ncbi:MAG: flagellar biosynthesis anti-sigma factor FlgM [Sedimenticola sp.]